MEFLDFGRALNLFRGTSLSEAEKQALFAETLLKTLALGAQADGHLHPCEITSVREALESEAGATISEAEVRVAAACELYETIPLTSFLKGRSRTLDPSQRAAVAKCLTRVLQCDRKVSDQELAFYDDVVRALKLAREEFEGLVPSGVGFPASFGFARCCEYTRTCW